VYAGKARHGPNSATLGLRIAQAALATDFEWDFLPSPAFRPPRSAILNGTRRFRLIFVSEAKSRGLPLMFFIF
jgi:hypothetical protein